ncbi:MAG: serine/threonine protein kinase [Deltaproteobacteria bacterium]|nr:serine/threonine protein kinase [Deltaproteobacteria bacterium]
MANASFAIDRSRGAEAGELIDSTDLELCGGEQIDQYRVLHLLGRGSMGAVYLAEDRALQRKVALKFVCSKSWHGELRERFLFEARTTARLSHPNIVTVYSVGEFRGWPYLALEYLDGGTLRQLLAPGPLEVPEALSFALQIARALQHAHRHGLLHRDLKPDNIMIANDGRLRVVDFGLAKSLGPLESADLSWQPFASTASETNAGIRGTPSYMAPEQWQGQGASRATDCWSFGVTLHELFTGRSPFAGKTALEHVGMVFRGKLKRLPRLSVFPPAAQRLLRACLRPEPSQRPTMETIVATLSRLVDGRRQRRRLVAAMLPLTALLLGVGISTLPAALELPAARRVSTPIGLSEQDSRERIFFAEPRARVVIPAAEPIASSPVDQPNHNALRRTSRAKAMRSMPPAAQSAATAARPSRRYVGEGLMDF